MHVGLIKKFRALKIKNWNCLSIISLSNISRLEVLSVINLTTEQEIKKIKTISEKIKNDEKILKFQR